MAKISVPRFYWRETDEYDTTPTGVVGAKVLHGLTGTNQDVLGSFELQTVSPPSRGNPQRPMIYQKLVGMHPQVEKTGYPVSGKRRPVVKYLTLLSCSSRKTAIRSSNIGLFEKQLESELDTSVEGFKDIKILP